MIEQTYKLNMIPRAEQDFRSYEPPVVHISQYDKVLRTLRFELYDGEDPFTIPENTAAYIYGMKPDGNAFQYQMDITEDGLLQIDVQTQMATVAGCVTCEVILFEGNESGNRIGSANFKMAVEKAAVGDDAQFSESDMPVIQTLLFGGTPGDVLVKDVNGVKWNSESLSAGYMRYDQYDPDRTGTVNSARQANNAATVDGHTVARNVLAGEYTNDEIDEKIEAGAGTAQWGQIAGTIGNQADLAAALNAKQDKEDGKGLSQENFTSAEKTKLAGIEAGAQVNTITGVKGDAETDYRTGNVNITKANIGLGNVDNTSDLDKPISTATQTALDGKQATLTFDTTPTAGSTNPVTSDGIATEISALNSNLNTKVSSVNEVLPDTNGNVTLNAEDIPADGVGAKDVSGNPIIITDAVAENAQDLSVELEPIQSGSGTPSPTNIRPISGRTQVDVLRTGKNLCPPVTIGQGYSPSTGDETTAGSQAASVKFPIDINKTYFFTKNCNLNAMFLAWDAQGNFVARSAGSNVSSRIIKASMFTIEGQGTGDLDSITQIALRFAAADGSQNIEDVIGAEYQVEEGDTATAYEPYAGQSVTVNLGQTVYGGTLNVTTGLLTVETANIASYNGESIGETWWSSMDEYVAGTTPTTGAQVVYTLATPTTVSLTPAQIALLEGYNILSTDGDNLNLRYTGTVASNVQSEIDEFEESTRTLAGSIAIIETSPATANHAVGDYLMLNNRLCKVTSAIATGESIIVGSNVSYTTVADELMAILAQINA